MFRVARFSSEVIAEAAAAFLRENDVPVSVVGHMLVETVSPRNVVRALDLLVDPGDRSRAESLLEEFHRTPAVLEEGWEDHPAEADLSLLDPAIAPECPACGEPLPRDSSLRACPACDEAVDLISLIIERHGPEALLPCYPSPEDSQDPAPRPRRCPACAGPLREQGSSGRCGSCGTLYDFSDHRR